MIRAPLLVRPKPYEGESLRGFLLRLGSENSLGSALLRHLDGSTGPMSPLSPAGLASSLRVDAIEFPKQWGSNWGSERSQQGAYGLRIPICHVRFSNCAVCPACLRASKAIRGEWEISAMCACPDHRCWLVDVCPHCSRTISWNRPEPSRCGCGGNLASAVIDKAPESVVAISALIADRYRGFARFQTLQAVNSHPDLAKLELQPLLRTVALLGHIGEPTRQNQALPSCVQMYSKRLKSEQAVAMSAARALSNWPKGLHASLLACSHGDEAGPRADIDWVTWPHLWFRLTPSPTRAKRMGLPRFVRDEVLKFREARICKFWGRSLMLLSGHVHRRADSGDPYSSCVWPKLDVSTYRRKTLSDRAIARVLGVTEERLGELRAASFFWGDPGRVTLGEFQKSLHRWSSCVRPCGDARDRDQLLQVVSSGETSLGDVVKDILSGKRKALVRRQGRPPSISNVYLDRMYDW
jgi:hypothetical protein